MKNLLFGGVRMQSAITDLALTALRVAVGLGLALGHGFGKIPVSDKFVEGVEALGFPVPVVFAWAAALAEAAGGILLAAGLLTRPAAFGIVFTMGVAFFLRHAADPFAVKELAFLYGIGAFVFLIAGSGRFAIDRALRSSGE